MISSYIKLLRPKQWLKNVFVLAPLIFAGMVGVGHVPVMLAAMQAFVAFSMAASAVYIFNDIYDTEADRQHPRKKNRPIAAGEVSVRAASCLAIILLAGSLFIAYVIPTKEHQYLFSTILAYIAINLFYTIKGKHIVICDAFCIAAGFVLRVICGAYAVGVIPTSWIVVTTFFLSLFLGFGKRRNEILALEAGSVHHRPVLDQYNLLFLDHILISTGTISIISYALYTLDQGIIRKFGTEKLIYTVPFVAYGIFRYIHLLLRNKEGDPTELIWQDRTLLVVAVSWLLFASAIIYYAGK